MQVVISNRTINGHSRMDRTRFNSSTSGQYFLSFPIKQIQNVKLFTLFGNFSSNVNSVGCICTGVTFFDMQFFMLLTFKGSTIFGSFEGNFLSKTLELVLFTQPLYTHRHRAFKANLQKPSRIIVKKEKISLLSVNTFGDYKCMPTKSLVALHWRARILTLNWKSVMEWTLPMGTSLLNGVNDVADWDTFPGKVWEGRTLTLRAEVLCTCAITVHLVDVRVYVRPTLYLHVENGLRGKFFFLFSSQEKFNIQRLIKMLFRISVLLFRFKSYRPTRWYQYTDLNGVREKSWQTGAERTRGDR